jgi:hypothetical protein
MVGALFCTECGAQLVDQNPTNTTNEQGQVIPQTPVALESPSPRQEEPLFPPPTQDVPLSLNIVSSGEIIPIRELMDVTLGRFSKGAPVIPDIDLSPYKAYESGVSRMHISIHIGEDQVSITDLGSVNGTRVNGRKISAHQPHPIKNGDILTLGKLKIQVLLKN